MEREILISERKEKRVVYTPELCTGCGICSQMCPKEAISMGLVGAVARGVIGDTYIKYGTKETTVDMVSCKYCGLCADACPVAAISVERRISEDRSLTFTGKVEIDGTKCIHCGWCSAVCPTNSITVQKPFEGIFELYIRGVHPPRPLGKYDY